MHELSLTESMLKTALAEAEKHGAKRLAVIRLKVGEMTQVDPTCVQFYLDILSKGTIAEGVQLAATRVPLRAACRECGEEFGLTPYDFLCPTCGSGQTEITSGRELYIDSIEIE